MESASNITFVYFDHFILVQNFGVNLLLIKKEKNFITGPNLYLCIFSSVSSNEDQTIHKHLVNEQIVHYPHTHTEEIIHKHTICALCLHIIVKVSLQ